MTSSSGIRQGPRLMLAAGALAVLALTPVGPGWAQHKPDKPFTAVLTDVQGVETEVRNVVFYWEEKVSETAFVPHEVKHLPVKRGTATIHVRFETIRQVEAKPGADQGAPLLHITLANGKTGEFTLAIPGSFRGESDFGQVDLPATTVSKVLFK
ncbi:hypothetical protein [Nitrospira sp. Kam-Ns4a]